jgi:uncharacterized protein (DUF1778 family)
MPIVAGTRISRQQALELAAKLARDGSDRTARVLLDAVTLDHDFVALSTDDREALLSVLDHPQDALVELRTTLFAELNWRRGIAGDHERRSRSPYVRRPPRHVEHG